MRYGILGPLEVRSPDESIALGGAKPRAVLAVLLLNAGEPVSAEQLAIALWGEETPADAAKTVQVHVSRLRKALGDPGLIETTAAGYRLRVEPGELDAADFERLVADGRTLLADGHAERAASRLREALDLWRGRPLSDLEDEPFAAAAIVRLNEQRLEALELRIDAELAAGWHAALVGELRQLAATYPTRERLAEQLMLALYRVGRQADALDVYRDAREAMVNELGLEPGPGLRELHGAILRQDPALRPAESQAPAAPAPAPATPRRRRPWRRRLVTAVAALAVIGTAGVVLTHGDALRSGSSVASETTYRAGVQRTCTAINAATRIGVRDQATLERSLRRVRGTPAQRDAILLATRRSIARGGQNLASLSALVPTASDAHVHTGAESAWSRSLDRLREYARRLDAAGSRAELLRAVAYLSASRSAIDRDGVAVAAALERLGRPGCRVQRVAFASVRLPRAPRPDDGAGSQRPGPGDPTPPVVPDRTPEPDGPAPQGDVEPPDDPDVNPPAVPNATPPGPAGAGSRDIDGGTARRGAGR